MMGYINLDGCGFIKAERILTIGRADAAPMRRLLAALPRDKVVTMTGGRPQVRGRGGVPRHG